MMALLALMGGRLHRAIELVGVDLQAEHGFHILAGARHVIGRIIAQVHHVIEAMLHLL